MQFVHFSSQLTETLIPVELPPPEARLQPPMNHTPCVRLAANLLVRTDGRGVPFKYLYVVDIPENDPALFEDRAMSSMGATFQRMFGATPALRLFYLAREVEPVERRVWNGSSYVTEATTTRTQRLISRAKRHITSLPNWFHRRSTPVPIGTPPPSLVTSSDPVAEEGLFQEWKSDHLTLMRGTEHLTGRGRVFITDRARVRLEVEVQLPEETLDDFPDPVRIEGKTLDGFTFVAPKCWINRITQPHDLAPDQLRQTTLLLSPLDVVITNDKLSSATWTKKRHWLKNAKVLGSAQRSLPTCTVRIGHLSNPGQQHRRGMLSAELNFELASPVAEKFDELTNDICRLLTIAQRCPTIAPLVAFYDGDTFVRAEIWECDWDGDSTVPLIGWGSDEQLQFVESCITGYQANATNYSLRALCYYYWRSHQESTLEIKFIFSSVFMEALKFAWAKNLSGLIKDVKASSGLIRAFQRPPTPTEISKARANGKTAKNVDMKFEELLNLTAQQVGAPSGVFTFIEERNAVFHTGETSAPQLGLPSAQHLKPELDKLHDQMDDMLLRILGYRGPIYSAAQPNLRIHFPGRTQI